MQHKVLLPWKEAYILTYSGHFVGRSLVSAALHTCFLVGHDMYMDGRVKSVCMEFLRDTTTGRARAFLEHHHVLHHLGISHSFVHCKDTHIAS